MENIKEIKRAAHDKVKEEKWRLCKEQHNQELEYLKCFWTWPWGHVWEKTRFSWVEKCSVCGKEILLHD
jgi:hypothetical protein